MLYCAIRLDPKDKLRTKDVYEKRIMK